MATKAELIAQVAKSANISKTAATKAVDALTTTITKTLKKGQTITLTGFGTFSVKARKARQGRNPQTGETIKIKARKVPAFKAGKALKESVSK
ncbi:MAG: HU family DNA-binding protein [Candidatus Omnitrophica bacterium]|nr:HU family DNA-binding protein [Candidatus Omnitrophota bacterium]